MPMWSTPCKANVEMGEPVRPDQWVQARRDRWLTVPSPIPIIRVGVSPAIASFLYCNLSKDYVLIIVINDICSITFRQFWRHRHTGSAARHLVDWSFASSALCLYAFPSLSCSQWHRRIAPAVPWYSFAMVSIQAPQRVSRRAAMAATRPKRDALFARHAKFSRSKQTSPNRRPWQTLWPPWHCLPRRLRGWYAGAHNAPSTPSSVPAGRLMS